MPFFGLPVLLKWTKFMFACIVYAFGKPPTPPGLMAHGPHFLTDLGRATIPSLPSFFVLLLDERMYATKEGSDFTLET